MYASIKRRFLGLSFFITGKERPKQESDDTKERIAIGPTEVLDLTQTADNKQPVHHERRTHEQPQLTVEYPQENKTPDVPSSEVNHAFQPPTIKRQPIHYASSGSKQQHRKFRRKTSAALRQQQNLCNVKRKPNSFIHNKINASSFFNNRNPFTPNKSSQLKKSYLSNQVAFQSPLISISSSLSPNNTPLTLTRSPKRKREPGLVLSIKKRRRVDKPPAAKDLASVRLVEESAGRTGFSIPEKDIEEWWIGDPLDEVFVRFKVVMHRKDLLSLRNGEWLNDEVINYASNAINKMMAKTSVHVWSTHFYSKLVQEEKYVYRNVMKWSKKMDIFSLDLIFVPIHISIHWTLAVIDIKHKTLAYYDSLGHDNMECLSYLLHWLKDEAKHKRGVALDVDSYTFLFPKKIPLQDNSCDCGMFVVGYMKAIAQSHRLLFDSTQFGFTQSSIHRMRKQLLQDIVTNTFTF